MATYLSINIMLFVKMKQEIKNYLIWRCKTNWHSRYLKYIDTWISNVTDTQLIYFEREMKNLINRNIYKLI